MDAIGGMFGFTEEARRGSYTDGNTEVSYESFSERMGNKLVGVCIGIALFFGSLGLIWWNEGRAVKTAATITEMESLLKTVGCDDLPSGMQGDLVHISCDINRATMGQFSNDFVNVTGLFLNDNIEKYQWIETKSVQTKKTGGGGKSSTTSYSYRQGWSGRLETFQGPNPPAGNRNTPNGMCGYSETGRQYPTSTVMAGNWELSRNILGKFSKSATVNTENGLKTIAPPQCDVTVAAPSTMDNACCSGNLCTTYSGSQRNGDCKLSFSYGSATQTSISGVVTGNTFEPYQSKEYPDYTQFFVDEEPKTKEEQIQDARDANTMMTWIIRIVGWLLCWMGSQMFFGPIILMPEIIPCIGDFIAGLVGCLLCCATCLCSSFWSFLIFAIAWIRFRPAIGIPLFIVACCLGGGLCYWRWTEKNKRDELKANQGAMGGDAAPAPEAAPAPAPAPAPVAAPVPAPAPAPGGAYPAPGGGGYPAPGGDAAYPAPGGGGYPAPGGGGGYPAPGQ